MGVINRTQTTVYCHVIHSQGKYAVPMLLKESEMFTSYGNNLPVRRAAYGLAVAFCSFFIVKFSIQRPHTCYPSDADALDASWSHLFHISMKTSSAVQYCSSQFCFCKVYVCELKTKHS